MIAEGSLLASAHVAEPWLSVVSAIYGVEQYLPEFLESLEAQDDGLDGVEIILVDDGATDGSGRIADEWAAQHPAHVRVIHQANAGQSAARNAGTRVARGEWVTYPDPDDTLGVNYFSKVRAFIRENPAISMVATHLVMHHEETNVKSDTHPLRYRFALGDHVVNVDRVSDYFHLHWASSFLRLADIRRLNLQGDPRVKPVGEDGHFIGRYLLGQDRALVGMLDSVEYIYRKRSDASSTIDRAKFMPERYVDPLRFGLLDLIETAKRTHGNVPRWLQTELIYELQWLLRPDLTAGVGSPTAADLGVASEFHKLVGEILSHVPPESVEAYRVTGLPELIRVALARGYRGKAWHSPAVQVAEFDHQERWVKFRYWYVGPAPAEKILVGGVAVSPKGAKRRRVDFAGKTLIWERIVWLPLRGQIAFELDGVAVPLSRDAGLSTMRDVRARDVDRMFRVKPRFAGGVKRKRASLWTRARGTWLRKFGLEARKARNAALVQKLASTAIVGRIFGDAWVLMDRDRNSWDNAEHLFRYLREYDRSVNAWFVVRRGTDDWVRLKREGYRRVVSFGSLTWKLLALNARFMISSHADVYVVRPPELAPYGGPRWRFVFLQHGVIHNDLSQWLNSKPIRLMVTTTEREAEFVADDGSPFVFTRREVLRSGLPRHDRLGRVAREWEGRRDVILVAPTWRQSLVGKLAAGNRERVDAFFDSEYFHAWQSFLTDPRLAESARTAGARIVFLPHPEMSPYLHDWAVPDGVEFASYVSADVQELIARSMVVVTDYSSVVFDAAAVRRPVVYFQFDLKDTYGGGHFIRRGYFDFATDGFGPVAEESGAAVMFVREIVVRHGEVDPVYLDRMVREFRAPDGKNRERVVKAVKRVEAGMKWA
ncbi:CDP-glycerol glycerophosphotransferase family protein [Luteimicrobium sp. DT211]|uniref:bifunctional glycosyltransferase/CDP-glycerol:glycerophosphate glycerophosphotransferase n=1 Tax=Luteimicrobium sp. DT211 TaxID=3393412 RepID=UPI003CF0DE97